jgi:hypothetical protein
MRKAVMTAAVLGLVVLLSSAASAQRLEVYGGYVYSHNNSTDGFSSNSNGGTADVGVFPFGGFGLIASVGGLSTGSFTHTQSGVATTYSASTSSVHYLFGIRQRINISRVTIYFQTLAGGVSRSAIIDSNAADAGKPGVNGPIPYTFSPAQTSWGVQPAIGLDIGLTHFFGIRVGQVAETLTGFHAVNTSGKFALQYSTSYSAGIIFKL